LFERDKLIDFLESLPEVPFEGDVFRAVRSGRDPTAPSTNGGRWGKQGRNSILYTSLAKEGAIAELSYHFGQLTPVPSKPFNVAKLKIRSERNLRLVRTDLEALGITGELSALPNNELTQEVGDVVDWLGLDGLIVPSARWKCENLILFFENGRPDLALELVETEEIAWQAWAVEHGFIDITR
jgi:RES domain